MKTRVSILFYAKKSKANKEGLVPIYTRITVSGKRIELSTNRFIKLSQWSQEGNCMKGNSIAASNINKYLDVLRLQIIDVQMELIHEKIPVTAESLKCKLLGTEIEKRMLIPIFEDHNKKVEALLGREFAFGTLERYKTSLKHTQEFLQWKYKSSDIDITEIDHVFITEYDFWLRSVRKCANNTAVKYIKNFKKIILLCIANGWLDKDPFLNYKAKLIQVERPYLSEAEIQAIYEKTFVSERLTQVRDVFLFCCYTGLAYADVKNLTKSHINIGIDGNKWIFTHRQKTKTATRVPLLPLAEQLINKYEHNPQCMNSNILLPVLTNQKMNSYLKEIADVCEITKNLTFHTARHTFATTVTLSNGVPIESVSKMLGHTDIKTTQHYAKILDLKISNDMKLLKQKIES